jgi:hypothetical protein
MTSLGADQKPARSQENQRSVPQAQRAPRHGADLLFRLAAGFLSQVFLFGKEGLKCLFT